MKTILITGSSSGFGLDIAKHFVEQDWNVVATMRTPVEDLLPASENLRVLPLDVKDDRSVHAAIEAAGPIDVLVNNAGIGWMNAFEGTSIDIARDLFETNTIGLMRVTQAVLPQFREKSAGTIINVSSAVTLKSLPLLSVYTATKAAVNAFTESLAAELEPFGIKVGIVLPGSAPSTNFGTTARSKIQAQGGFHPAYADFINDVIAKTQQSQGLRTQSTDVVEAVWKAATDDNSPLRLPAGADAIAWAS